MRKGILFVGVLLVAVLMAGGAYAQGHGVQAGIFNPGSGSADTLVVKIQPLFTVTSKTLSAYTVTIRWQTSYGITLSAPTSPSGSAMQDPVQTNGAYSYQVFSGSPLGYTVTWTAGTAYELFRTRVGGNTGVGVFELVGTPAPQALPFYLELGGRDSTYSGSGSPFYISSTAAPLPVQIASFTGLLATAGEADLHWSTVSEVNNFGFEVQKSSDALSGFTTITGSFQEGNGTTNVRHDYAYVDRNYSSSTPYYRLKQYDKDATFHFTESIQPSSLSGVAEKKPMPTEYALSQNYPNPFNPSTVIEFALPRDSRVKLEVFNILGQQVMTLVDEVRAAGYHSVRVDGKDLASGMYLYRLSTGTQSIMRKFLLLK
jgi:hypothetical protein